MKIFRNSPIFFTKHQRFEKATSLSAAFFLGMALAVLTPNFAVGRSYDLCSQVDRDNIVIQTQNVRIQIVNQSEVSPGSELTVEGQNFFGVRGLLSDLNFRFRFFVYNSISG